MLNKVELIGRVGKDPEIRTTAGDRKVANLSLATSERYKTKEGEIKTNTEWHNLVLWSPLAEIAGKYVRKGTLLRVEGKITTRSYDDKEGQKRYITEIVVRDMLMLGDKSRAEDETGAPAAESSSTNAPAPADDMPF